MGKYRSAGGIDDESVVDGDGGFVGMSQRGGRNQLGEGMLWLSKNGRIDGHWEVRKGIELVSGVIGSGDGVLKVPFLVSDGVIDEDTPLVVSATTLSVEGGVAMVRVLFDRPIDSWVLRHYETKEIAEGWVALGDDDDGEWVFGDGVSSVECVKAGKLYYAKAVAGESGDFRSMDMLVPVEEANEGEVAGSPVNPVHAGKYSAVVNDEAVNAIWGSCVFSNPNADEGDAILLATSGSVRKVLMREPGVNTVIPFTAGVGGLNEPVEMLQAFDRVMLFRRGERVLEYRPNGVAVESATRAGGVLTLTVVNHGLSAGDVVVLSGFDGAGAPVGEVTVVAVVSPDSFTVANAGADGVFTDGKMVFEGFALGLGGLYTQPETFRVNESAVTVVDGLVTVEVFENQTLKAGNALVVRGTDIPEFDGLVSKEFRVVSATESLVSFYADVADFTAATTVKFFEFGGRVSVGGGFMHQPGAAWGVYFQRRLWVPYEFEVGGSAEFPTYEFRGRKDEIAASDILDPDTFDRIESQFRITAGIADEVMGMQPFYDDALMILNRNSLHLVAGTQGGLEDTVVKELTREVGCVARKSVAMYGNAVFFLSDNGVYGVEFLDGYNMRGLSDPLSRPIQPFIDSISKELADKAVGIYFNNRYWLAVPLDKRDGSEPAKGNNVVLVFNLLNKAWESVDTFGETDFQIIAFHVARGESRNDLYVVNQYGGIHKVDSLDRPVDRVSIGTLGEMAEHPVAYEMETRGYGFKTGERKRFSACMVQVESNQANCEAEFFFNSEDPDEAEISLGTINSLTGGLLPPMESANLRMRLAGMRGFFGSLKVRSHDGEVTGRPRINTITVDATIHNRQTYSQK